MSATTQNLKPSVAVIGGGLAGLSAGCALAEAGYHVELFEQRPYLGGRASSYELPATGEVVDNCQHVLLGCCTNLIDFYRRLGVENQIRWYDEITFILPGGKSSVLRPGELPAPMHSAVSFLESFVLDLKDKLAVARALGVGLTEICKTCDASGVHVTFATEAEFRLLGELGYLQRTDQQFHWENRGFANFDEFLGALTARKRKTIRRERHDALANGIIVHWLTGNDLTEEIWDAFFQFYMETGSRKWGRPYLTRPFYSLVGQSMRQHIVLIMAKRAGRWIAGAINFVGSHSLFGRHWGAIEHHPFLHFELCYYQAIDYAITHKLLRVEAGAQGEHKITRGYLPSMTYSAHYIADPALRRGIAEYLARERAYVAAAGAELATFAPFRKNFVLETD